MRKNLFLLLVCVSLQIVKSQNSNKGSINVYHRNNKGALEIVVHRGANALAPENTIASADSALAHGAKWIEVDVRPSKDQVLFNLHDETLDRTTDGKGRLVDMLAKDVCKLDAGAWFSHKYVGVSVPTIADMLDHLRGKAKVFFDVKRGTSVSQLVKLVREKGFAKNSFFWFGDENMLREFIRIAPDMKVKVNAANVERLKYWQSFCKPAYVEIAPQNITRQFIEYCHRHGILVMAACQEDDTSQFQMCIDKNADLVNLDRPEIFQRVQKRLDLKTILLKIPADGKTLCTSQLQQAIDRIAKRGWGTLVLTPGTYLSGSIFLKSGVTLKLEKGAVLLGSPNPYQYMKADVNANGQDARHDNASMALVVAQNAKDVCIINEGVIDGNGLAVALNADSLHHTGELVDAHYNVRRQRPSEVVRPKLFFFTHCDHVRIEGGEYRSSANWGLSFDLCSNMILTGLEVHNRAYWNNDGIDITDCQHVKISNCKINSADDGICLKSYHVDSEGNRDIKIDNCDIISSASAVKFGTASWGGFRDIEISHIRVKDTYRSAIAIESVDGAIINNVYVHDIHAVNTGNPIFIRLGQRAGDRKGSVNHVTIKNLYCQVPFGKPDEAYDLRGPGLDVIHNPIPSSITGIPDNRIGKVTLENIEIEYPGRATKGQAYIPLWRVQDVPEQVKKYPEFSMFGELPAYGFYLRHIENVIFKNVKMKLKESDYRPAIVMDDVENAVMNEVYPNSIFKRKL